MKVPLLKSNSRILGILATVLFIPALTRAATVIDHAPYTITASGKYELNSDLTADGTVGITVNAPDVVIDLNGYSLTQKKTGTIWDGVEIFAPNVIVRNGTISGLIRPCP